MKKTVLILILALVSFGTKAQDIIVKNDKTEIKAKIEELTETTIKYKKFDMLDGPIYNISVNDVFMIMYKNGTKEYIQSKKDIQPIVQNNTPVAAIAQNTPTNRSVKTNGTGKHEELKFVKKNLYSFEGEDVAGYQGYYAIFDKYGYTDLSKNLRSSVKITYIALGAGLLFLGGSFLVRGSTPKYILLGAGLGCAFGSSPNAGLKSSVRAFNARANKSVGLNSKLEIKPLFASDNAGNHIGLNIKF